MTHRDLANWCRNGGEILIGDTTVYSCWTYDLRDANVPYIAKNIKIRKVGEDTWHEPEITLKPEDTWFDYDRESYEHNNPQCIQSELQYGKKYKCYRTNGTCVSLFYHGIPSDGKYPVFSEHLNLVVSVFSEHLNLVVSDDWYKVSEFCMFELDE
ncbi:MAG: hypothetical protein MJZ25_09215 [Fibrobacter sp.]|nr:hypothetical protein [Fibrobacter sp.]